MKNLLITLCLLTWTFSSGWTQTNYLQWETSYMKPKIAQLDMFKKGLAAHAKKYHAADPYKMFAFDVITGPNSGSYFVVLGPATFTQLDKRPSSPEHDTDWQNNVRVHIESESEGAYWRLDSTLNYSPAGSDNYSKSRLRWITLNPGESDRYEEQLKKVVEVYKAKGYKARWSAYWRYGASTGPHLCTEIAFDNWAYLDNQPDFMKDFEDVHGAGSFTRFLEEIAIAADRTKTFDELIVLDPDLSSPQQ